MFKKLSIIKDKANGDEKCKATASSQGGKARNIKKINRYL